MSVNTTLPARHRENGQVLVVFVVFLIVLFASTALAVDYGSWLKIRRDYTNVADSAALAGAAHLGRPVGTGKRQQAREAAWEELNRQLSLGLSRGQIQGRSQSSTGVLGDAIAGYRLWVASPPIDAGAKYIGSQTSLSSRTIFVHVERDNPAYLSRVIGFTDRTVSAWATAGLFPSRFAVITLRQTNQAPNFANADIFLGGNDTTLEVIDGDVGGNWNMKLNSSTQLWIRGFTQNDADVYLVDNVSCGNSCWSAGQVNSGPNGNPAYETRAPLPLDPPIPDPDYPLPSPLAVYPVPPGAVSPQIPTGDPYPDGSCCRFSSPGNVSVKSGGQDQAPGGTETDLSGVLQCKADSPKIGPGFYSKIDLDAGTCLILDPTMRHSSIVASSPDVPQAVPQDQWPGIFYVNGSITLGQSAMLVGDGVTIVMYPGSSNEMKINAGGVIELNRGMTPGLGSARELGAWTKDAQQPYTWNGSQWDYLSSMESDPANVGMALYVIRREQYDNSVAVDDNSSVIKANSTGSALAWKGITYAPHDNVAINGQPGHDGIGQLVAWTFTIAGGVNVKQEYRGPGDLVPRLIEPRLGQP